ncbi:hypothetical protein KY289_019672 [Solanum tuberosum]|nr:hypothetical protein KY289_019672 [Solanum tuberosum]
MPIIIICWEIWRSWTSCKFGDANKFRRSYMKHQIAWNIKAAIYKTFPNLKLDGRWTEICDTIERLRHIVIWRQVSWSKPLLNVVKFNTDASYDITNGKAGLGCVIRNHNGDLNMSFSIAVQCGSNNQAEAVAANYGLKWCIHNGFTEIQLELDSLIIVDMLINNRDTTNMKLIRIIQDTIQNMDKLDIIVSNCYREANSGADFFAKQAYSSGHA